MQRRHGMFRLLGIIAMVVQLVLPATLAFADAALQRADRGATAHVEEHGSPACHRVHADDCALCRTLSQLTATREEAPGVPIARVSSRAGVALAIGARASEHWFGPPPSRAPPV